MKRPPESEIAFAPWKSSISYPSGFAVDVEPFTFAAVADPHCDETPSSLKHGRGFEHLGDGVGRLRRCLDAIDRMDPANKPAFVFLLGDIGIEAAEPILAEAPCLIHAIAGNHDWGHRRQRLRKLFPSDFGTDNQASDYYAFEHGGARFVAICNAGTGNEHTGQLASEDIRPPGQAAWIAEQLSTTSGPKILLGHCPPQPAGFDVQKYMETARHSYLPFMGDCDSRFLNELLVSHGPIAAFFGHLHRATASYACGSSQVHVLRSCNWNHDAEPIGFAQVRVDQSGVSVREALTGFYR